jgi:hypothetical protein
MSRVYFIETQARDIRTGDAILAGADRRYSIVRTIEHNHPGDVTFVLDNDQRVIFADRDPVTHEVMA